MTETAHIEEVATVRKPRAKSAKTDLVKIEKSATSTNQVATTDTAAILGMIERIMVDPNASVERANQAFEFYQRVQADQAKRAFSAAMVDAKAKFTPIIKKHLVEYGEDKKKTSYRHESLADIAAVIDPILGEHGLSARHTGSSNPNEPIRVTCIIEHTLGHREEVTLTAGADNSGGKNSIQAIGSTITYLQRYTLRIALGLSTGREDDGNAADRADDGPISEAQLAELIALADERGVNKARFCKFYEIESFADIQRSQFEKAKFNIENAKVRQQ